MNKFAIICLVVAASLVKNDAAQITEDQKSKLYGMLLTNGMECMKDFPLSLDHVKTFRNKKVPDDEAAKCFCNCLLKKFGVMDNNGKISQKMGMEASMKVFKEGTDDDMLMKIEELFSKCIHVNDAEIKGDKGCDRAKLATECFLKHASVLGIDVQI